MSAKREENVGSCDRPGARAPHGARSGRDARGPSEDVALCDIVRSFATKTSRAKDGRRSDMDPIRMVVVGG